jgi:hypothetical protein
MGDVILRKDKTMTSDFSQTNDTLILRTLAVDAARAELSRVELFGTLPGASPLVVGTAAIRLYMGGSNFAKPTSVTSQPAPQSMKPKNYRSFR